MPESAAEHFPPRGRNFWWLHKSLPRWMRPDSCRGRAASRAGTISLFQKETTQMDTTEQSETAAAALREIMNERDAQVVTSNVSGGVKVRYVRIYVSTFYRFEDITMAAVVALGLPIVLAEGMRTAATYDDDDGLTSKLMQAISATKVQANAVAVDSARTGPHSQGGAKVPRRRNPKGTPPAGDSIAMMNAEVGR